MYTILKLYTVKSTFFLIVQSNCTYLYHLAFDLHTF